MRTVLLLTVIVVACAAAAQSAAARQQNSASASPAIVTVDQSSGGYPKARRPENSDRLSGTCFTMRSYIFERRDGEAPRLVGMTKCTPGNRFWSKRALKQPGWGVYPLGSGFAPAAEPKR